jgi:2-desacetyl-2-hydroxyethyl bacteriochlorophyllide A dehydrogenase
MDNNPTVVFVRPGEVVIENREKPSPKTGELLIKTRCTLISTGTELTILSGDFPSDSAWARYGKFPFVPGYNNVGEVIDVGPDIDQNWIGQRIATYGSHALYVTTNIQSARLICQDILDEHAVFFTIAEIVMNGIRRANVQWGEAVVVYGLGLLGQLTVRFCRLCGARPVLAVDVAESRLQQLPSDVAIVPVNARRDNVVSLVEKVTKRRMADVVFEVTGDPELILEEFKVLRQQGRLIVLSSPRGKTWFDFHDLCNSPSFTIIGAHNLSHPQNETLDNPWTNQRHAELFFDLVADGELVIDPLISHREPYTEACRLYQMLLEDRSLAMGVILEWFLK